MKKSLTAAGLAVGLVAGGTAGLVLAPAAALGQPVAPVGGAETAEGVVVEHGAHLSGVLAPLVAKGTITQAQADQVIAALKAAGPRHGSDGPRRHGFHVALDTVATALGISEDALRAALRSDQSIADVARSKGVAPQKVVDALVTEARERLAKKVAAGDLTQAQADDRLAAATKMITALVNGDLPRPGDPHRGPAFTPAPAGDEHTIDESGWADA